MGNGLDQATARRRARTMGGIAVSARPGKNEKWVIGGWPGPDDVWVVVGLDGRTVLDDGGPTLFSRAPARELTEGEFETLRRLEKGPQPATVVHGRSLSLLESLIAKGWVDYVSAREMHLTAAGLAALVGHRKALAA